MDITLVSASNGKEVHGTDNEKKTGCGINLLRGENVTVYRRIGRMTDLKEITCEKCKANLAKKIIKADKKEMSRLLKEEKQRERMGMGDEGIVPLGNTTAKITRSPEQIRQDEQRARYGLPPAGAPVQPAPQAAPVQPQPKPEPVKTIPGTGVAMDNSLAAFAINKPAAAPEQPKQDDFASQFAFQKPVSEEKPVHDDFLAQFAVPADEKTVQESQPVQEIPAEPTPAPAPAASAVIDNVDDILSMFSVENVASQGVPSSPAFSNNPNVINTQEVKTPAPDMGSVDQWNTSSEQFLGGSQPQTVPQPSVQPAAPVIEDIPAPADISAAQPNDIPVQPSVPVIEDISVPTADIPSAIEDAVLETASYDANEKPAVQELDDIMSTPEEPAEKVGLYKEEIMDIKDNNGAVQQGSAQQPQNTPVQPQTQAAPVIQPQIITVPQLAGYDQNGQPVYNYIQMKMTGLDQNGQPVFAPVDGQPVRPAASVHTRSSVPQRPVTFNQGVPKANVSKIAVNPHAKQTSQAFINAIASSKEYADKNLIETQGLKANTPILSSVEDVLSTMGDDSARQKMLAEQQKSQQQKSVTSFNEYKGPSAQQNRRPVPPQFRNTPSQQQMRDPRNMTKSELKAYKKQEKIEAKFKKEMAKRGGY